MRYIRPEAPLVSPNWLYCVDQGWISAGNIRADVQEPFFGSEIAIGAPRGAPECPKSASKCHKWGWSKSIVLENEVAINFDFRSGAKKTGHMDYPLQSYGPKQVIKNHAW